MEKKKNTQKSTPRRRPPEEPPKQKAPHAKPRKNPPVQEQPVRVTPEVVYLAPKPFSRNRLILRLATIVAVVLALMLGLSIFFKVERIEVSGCSQYTAWQVQQASGIEVGDQLLTFSRARASGKITDQLPYVKYVRIGISLPDTVKIEIVETRVTYALQDQAGNWWLMDSDGKLIEQAAAGTEGEHTLVTGVTLDAPVAGQSAAAYEDAQAGTDAEGNVIPVTVTAAQKLSTVIDLADYLEQNGIIGEIATMDVSNLYDMELWYRVKSQSLDTYQNKFQIQLGDTTDLSRKIRYLKSFVDDYTQNRPYESGLLDLSNPDHIEYRSFETENE